MPKELTPEEVEREAQAAERAAVVQEQWGHPQGAVGHAHRTHPEHKRDGVRGVRDEWLALMWCLDQYRVADAPPEGMGKRGLKYEGRMDGILPRLGQLVPATMPHPAAQQPHRTDATEPLRYQGLLAEPPDRLGLARPRRGADRVRREQAHRGPAYRAAPGRGAMDDWTNRRRELKFSAADLKLAALAGEKIGHWDVWR